MTSEASGADFNDPPVDALLVFMLGPASTIARILQGTNFIKALEGGTMRDQYITVGQVGAVGPNAAAHQITFSQAWAGLSDSMDLLDLKQELSKLRLALHREASKPEHALAIAEVAKAESAAERGDGAKVLEHLRNAGKWVLSIATTIGTLLAATAITAAIGL